MKLQQLLQQLDHEPCLVLPEAHAALRQWLESRIECPEAPLARQPGKDWWSGEEVETEQMEVIDGIAHIPIVGFIGRNLSGEIGGVDVDEIIDEIDKAETDSRVRAVIFEIESPGGTYTGTPELAQRIEIMEKDSIAFTNGTMASAAYWLAASAELIYATRSASVGSIGIVAPVFDSTRAFEARGIKVELIKGGRLKGMGYPGTSLSESAREHMQALVDEVYREFTDHVRSKRPGKEITGETMQGQMFLAKDALTRGLIDGIVDDKNAALAELG